MSRRLYLITLAIVLLGTATLSTYPVQAAVPAAFSQSGALVTVNQPTALAFSADNTQLLITEKGGKLRLVDIAADRSLTLRSTAVIDLTSRICSNSERGLLGVALDAQFTTNRLFYLFYTYDKSNSCAANSASSPVNRVSRFTLGANGTASLSSERILIDNMPSPNGNHNAGDLHIGKDGYLYISIGDGGCDYAGGGCGGSNNASRDVHVLTGKILRIIPNPNLTPSQRIPSTNPYATSGGVCAVDGRTTSGTPCKETFAFGLRNPFRMAFDPNTLAPATTFYINDVGQGIWEEVNRGEAGADYRWNICEGSYVNGTHTLCSAPQGVQRNPIHEYAHDGAGTTGCDSITGGAIVPNGVWPTGYAGAYLFADYVCGKIFQINPSAPASRVTFASNIGAISHMSFGPGPSNSQALYYARIDDGTIRRIWPTGNANGAPDAVLSATPQFGSVNVTFNGSASSDPNGDTLTYLWSFGNGVTRTTTSSTTSYTYPADGRYTAQLQVRDPAGALSNTANLTIDTLDTLPQVTLNLPAQAATFAVGDIITLQASATDLEDGTLPDSAITWEVLLHHRAGQVGAHTHPYFGPVVGNNLSFEAPLPEDFDAASNSYLEVRVTATDTAGATATVSRDLLPAKVTLQVNTVPAGLTVSINGALVHDQQPFISWRGYPLNMVAYPQHAADGRWLALSSWENNTTATARQVVTPASSTTYTATFGRDAALVWFPLVASP